MSNEFEIVIRLPRADGFHHKNDQHLAETVQRRVHDLLTAIPVRGSGSTVVDVRKADRSA